MKRLLLDVHLRVRILAAPLIVCALVGGCASTVSPQLFPPPMVVSEEERAVTACDAYLASRNEERKGDAALWLFDSQLTLCRARERADLLRREYVGAVVDQSAERSVINTMLLGIGGVAGYQLLKHGLDGSNATLRYLAAAGGTVYGYSTLTLPHARQVVYLGGAEALTCIYGASDELQISPAELGSIINDEAALRASIENLRTIMGNKFKEEYGRPDRCKTNRSSPTGCESGANDVGKKLFDAARPKGCVDRPAVTTCDESLPRASEALEPEISEAERLHARVRIQLSRIGAKAGEVRQATDKVSYSISGEVLKTEASSAAVLSTIESMRGVVSQLMGSAQSGEKFLSKLPSADDKRVRYPEFEAAVYQLRNTAARVREHEQALSGRLSAFPDKMGACQGIETMGRITVEPNPDQLTLVPNRLFTLFATGSNATPSVNLLDDPASAVSLLKLSPFDGRHQGHCGSKLSTGARLRRLIRRQSARRWITCGADR
ncbi:hypothetical protein, partial [Aromatoleum evansii]|uniref:hypothetical protein n=1 Tax=Aromatoleum evansii TaxID=59406 RepID=UPI00145D6A5A